MCASTSMHVQINNNNVCLTSVFLFFFNDPATTEIYTLSLHDALPISPVKVSRGPRLPAVRQACPFVGGMRGVSPEMDAAMPKKQTTAGKKARAAAREGEKYTTALRRQLPPGTGPAAVPYVSETGAAHPICLEHRSLLDHAPGFRPFR